MPLLLQNVVLDDRDAVDLAAAVLDLPRERVTTAEIVRRGVDARTRPAVWRGNLRVELDRGEEAVLALGRAGVRRWSERDQVRREGVIPAGRPAWPARPIVVGAGPAGIFAALRLVEAGAPVLLLERGEPVETRVGTVNGFWRGKPLDPDSNLLFGEGGAGTFSDGKVYTRRRDGDLGWIFRHLVDAGADAAVLEESWAHLGTDRIRAILPVLRQKIIDGGGEVRFRARMTDLVVHHGRCVGVRLASGEEVLGGPVLVAPGHSARDTVDAMLRAGAAAELRPIAIGARVEHPQALIDAGLYPKGRGDLPPASYRLAHNPVGGRSTYTFCMCPGGMVVPAQHEPGTNVVNGMSFSARRAVWANSAVIVQVGPEDYGGIDPRAGQRFQSRIEAEAWRLTGSFAAPAQRVDDFLADRPSRDLPRSSYPFGLAPVELRALLPAAVIEGMKGALRAFDEKIPGFASGAGVLIAPETRTTSPLRLLRGANAESPTLPGLVPSGEGAGWGGGIVSAAHDGFVVAEKMIEGAGAAPRPS